MQKFSTNFPHLADNACLTDFCQHFLPQSFLPQKDALMKFSLPLATLLLGALPLAAQAQKPAPAAPATLAQAEPQIRKALAQRLPNMPKIEEVRATPIAGLYELRLGASDIFYSDAKGDYLLQGEMLDTKTRNNLTQARLDQLTAVNFKALPIKDAIVLKYGNGSRKLAVFEDPSCSYCHHFEAALAKVKDVTVYVFLYPILGAKSSAMSKDIWCAKDKAKVWQDWMLRKVTPPAAPAQCDVSALARNVEFGRKYRINGTPALIFANGKRVPGAADTATLEKLLAENK